MCINARMSTGMLGAQSVASKEAHHWHRPQPDSISLASAPPPLAQQEALLRQLTLRNKVHAIFDARGVAETLYAGRHQTLSNTVIATTLVAILVSVVLLILDGMPRYSVPDEPVMVLETICVGWFTLELTVRMVTVQDKLSFWKELLNWIDVIAILPYYIDLIIILSTERGRGGSPNGYLVLRVVRLARIFRLFKLTKYNSDLQLVGIAMSNSTDALSLLLFMTTIAGVLVASGVFFAEQVAATWDPRREEWVRKPEYGGTHEFQSIPHAFWFALATVSSVGYGDMVPVSPVGYCIASAAVLVGTVIVAFPVIILSSNFVQARDVHRRMLKNAGREASAVSASHRRDGPESVAADFPMFPTAPLPHVSTERSLASMKKSARNLSQRRCPQQLGDVLKRLDRITNSLSDLKKTDMFRSRNVCPQPSPLPLDLSECPKPRDSAVVR
ncbi:Potassium voltage-gated channel protein Shaker [Diplonema papillatum]|nr:Potassium voltage-gated channel protein Shaker [Diplonema papillatum]